MELDNVFTLQTQTREDEDIFDTVQYCSPKAPSIFRVNFRGKETELCIVLTMLEEGTGRDPVNGVEGLAGWRNCYKTW